MKPVNGRCTEEYFPYYKLMFALPTLRWLKIVVGIKAYLKLVKKPKAFETEMNNLFAQGIPCG